MYRITRLRGAPGLAATVLMIAGSPAAAQSTAPSSITPPTLRPPPVAGDAPPALPAPSSLAPPAGSAGLRVRAGRVDVIGGFPALAPETQAIADRIAGRTVTLAEIYAAAAAIEAAHVRRGYILARAVVPPQQIDDGGTITIRIVDGVIERIDLAALPARVRNAVRARVEALEGRRQPTLGEIERRLTIAGDVPGLAIASTLARGETAGGTQLLLSGRYTPVRAVLSVDNNLSPSLDHVAVTAQVSLNSVLGLGEQLYGFAVTGYDVPRAFEKDAPVRVLGGGAILGVGDGRLSLNPEATFSRTQPLPQPGVPRIRGTLRRLTLRGGYVLAKSRRATVSAGLAIERIREANDAIDFATLLSLDDFTAARATLSYAAALPRGGGVSLIAQLSQGLRRDGVGDVPVSRQGAREHFTRAAITARLSRPLGARYALSLVARGQVPFGQALYRSEQSTLEGADALSSYIGGITAVDGSATVRAELSRAPLAVGPLRVSPYLFGAVGRGWIGNPTAVEEARYTLYNPGLGLRGSLAGGHVGLNVEYGHGFSAVSRFDRVDRVAAGLTLAL